MRPWARLLIALALSLQSASASAAMPEVGLPSLSTTDGRFLGLSGQGLQTLTQPSKYFVGVASTETTFSVGVFDGDLGGRWDNHDPLNSVRTEFLLYADPNRTGDPAGKTLIASLSSDQVADDAWRDLYRGPVHPAARAYSGHYFYVLLVRWTSPAQSANEFNGFRLRAEGQLSITPGDWAFVAAPINVGVDPALGSAGNSYGGTWDWFVYVPPAQGRVRFSECDADARTADPSGQPPDDETTDARVRVPPDVRYTVFDPSEQLVANVPVPSGNAVCVSREAPGTPAGGVYRWSWFGVDAHNLIFVQLSYEASAQRATPLPVGSPPAATPTPSPTSPPVPTLTPTATPRPAPAAGGGSAPPPAPPATPTPSPQPTATPAPPTPSPTATPPPPTPSPAAQTTAAPGTAPSATALATRTARRTAPVVLQLPRTGAPPPALLLAGAAAAVAAGLALSRRRGR